MASEEGLVTRTRPAGADLSSHQFKVVKLNSSGQVISASAQGERVYGVLQDNPAAAGRAACVAVGGRTIVKLGATVAPGELVTTQADGDVEVAAASDFVIGQCIEGGAAGEYGSIELRLDGVL